MLFRYSISNTYLIEGFVEVASSNLSQGAVATWDYTVKIQGTVA